MLYPINPAAEAELRGVLAFQRQVLAFACRIGLAKPLVRTDVNAHFGAQANWFWRHWGLKNRVVALNDIIGNDATLAAQVLAAFDNDVSFDQHVNDGNFSFSCCTLLNTVKPALAALLKNFYEILDSDGGFDPEITGANAITRQEVVQGFHTLNADLLVCPACDGPRSDRTENVVHSQCDHYFPKSIHCALSIHPRNLVPVCEGCNLTFKGENDANDHALVSEMFLPYVREAFGPLEAQANRNGNGELLIALDDGGVLDTRRVQSLNHILNLQERWSTRLQDRVAPSITNKFRHQLRRAAQRGETIDLLPDISAQREARRNARRAEHDSIVAEAYLRLLEQDHNERALLMV